MGSVEWGWETDNAGTFKKLPLTLKSADIPTEGFMKAAKLWNDATVLGTIKTGYDIWRIQDMQESDIVIFACAVTILAMGLLADLIVVQGKR